jgi:hypothetical protein
MNTLYNVANYFSFLSFTVSIFCLLEISPLKKLENENMNFGLISVKDIIEFRNLFVNKIRYLLH